MYCGYKNSKAFFTNDNIYTSWNTHNLFIQKLESSPPNDVIDFIIENFQHKNRTTMVILLFQKLIYTQDYNSLLLLFKRTSSFFSFSIDEKTTIATVVGTTFRNHSFSNSFLKEVAQQKNLVFTFLHYFVDYSIKNTNYVTLLKHTSNRDYNATDTAFKYLFLATQHAFKEAKTEFITCAKKGLAISYVSLQSPYVRGRYLYIEYLYEMQSEKTNDTQHWRDYIKGTSFHIAEVSHLLKAFVQHNAIADFKNLIQKCFVHLPKTSSHWFFKNEQTQHHILIALYYFLEGKPIKASAFLQTIALEEHSNVFSKEINTYWYFLVAEIIDNTRTIAQSKEVLKVYEKALAGHPNTTTILQYYKKTLKSVPVLY